MREQVAPLPGQRSRNLTPRPGRSRASFHGQVLRQMGAMRTVRHYLFARNTAAQQADAADIAGVRGGAVTLHFRRLRRRPCWCTPTWPRRIWCNAGSRLSSTRYLPEGHPRRAHHRGRDHRAGRRLGREGDPPARARQRRRSLGARTAAKMFITNGVHADLYFVAARTDSRRQGLACHLHVHRREGRTRVSRVGRALKKTGWRAPDYRRSSVFEDCRIPAAEPARARRTPASTQ